MRPKLPTSNLFYMNDVLKAVSVDPKIVARVKSLIKPTGKRGRPRTRIDGRKVVSLLKREHADQALKTFKELAVSTASHN